jgi:hypothetical protein
MFSPTRSPALYSSEMLFMSLPSFLRTHFKFFHSFFFVSTVCFHVVFVNAPRFPSFFGYIKRQAQRESDSPDVISAISRRKAGEERGKTEWIECTGKLNPESHQIKLI